MNRRKLERLIREKIKEGKLKEWHHSLDDDDFLEVSRIVHQMGKQSPLYQQSESFRHEVDKMKDGADKYEEICAKEISSKLMHEVTMDGHFKELSKNMKQLQITLAEGIRKSPHDAGLKKVAKEMIEIIRDSEDYDESIWKDIDLNA